LFLEAWLRKGKKMLKKSLIAIAVLAIAMPCFAGTLKVHGDWSQTTVITYDPMLVATIDVLINVGYYIHLVDQDAITITQCDLAVYDYCGSYTTATVSNFRAQVSANIAADAGSAAGGTWTITGISTLSNDDDIIEIGDDELTIGIKGEALAIAGLTAGTADYKVANLNVLVIPAA
jgi:hypothetical protein